MQYVAKFSCGHEATVQLYGRYADRERKLEWYAEHGLCPDCYRAKKEQERAQEYEQAKQKTADLIELQGSEKQIAWATVIRARIVDEIVIFDELLKKSPADEKLKEPYYLARDAVLGNNSAHFWIDNRLETARDLLTQQREKK